MRTEISYDQLVGYPDLDPFKKLCLQAGIATGKQFNHPLLKEVFSSRGESAHVMEFPDWYNAFVVEGLGTANVAADKFLMQLVAQDMGYAQTGRTFYDVAGKTTVAMIVNDLITVGALPYQISMYAAVGNSAWFKNEQRAADLVEGFKQACLDSEAIWGGGETPSLADIIYPETIDLGGAANGLIWPKSNLITSTNIKHGDAILLCESSGIHGNGWTKVREIGSRLTDGYLTKLPSGTLFGEAALQPTHIYVRFMKSLLEKGIVPHYAVNITGHGFRKLMRANEKFEYILHTLSKPQEIFEFIKDQTNYSFEDMYQTFNMNAGFGVYIDPIHITTAIQCAQTVGLEAWDAGRIYSSTKKRVVLEPYHIEYKEETLDIR